MKKIILLSTILGLVFTASSFATDPENNEKSDNDSESKKTEIVLNEEDSFTEAEEEGSISEEELLKYEKRVEEIRNMDIESLSFKEKRELRKELKEMPKNVKKDDVYVMTGTTLLLLILLLLML